MSPHRHTKSACQPADVLDRFFNWSERTFCPHNLVQKNMEEPDVLDYVFQNVESFVCQEDLSDEPELLISDQKMGLKRDNSLLETEQDGRPALLQTQRKIKPFGQDGDLIDVVFEHVESFVCAEDLSEGALENAPIAAVTPPRKDMTYKAAKKRFENVYGQEEEIQLYFRPSKRYHDC